MEFRFAVGLPVFISAVWCFLGYCASCFVDLLCFIAFAGFSCLWFTRLLVSWVPVVLGLFFSFDFLLAYAVDCCVWFVIWCFVLS